MARKAANVTSEEFLAIWNCFIKDEFVNYSVEQRQRIALPQICDEVNSIAKDLQKVNFDFENWGFHTETGEVASSDFIPVKLGNLTCFLCYAGGDWEYPVSFIIYLDKNRKTFRAYIPKEGNAWNYDTAEAIGNGYDYDKREDKDVIFLRKWCKKNAPEVQISGNEFDSCDGEIMVNHEKMVEDINNRIEVI